MKKQKLGKKRIPWWYDEPWKGWWKKFRRKQARKLLRKHNNANKVKEILEK